MPRNIVVLGPPGTGKSESCLTVSRGWFKDGCSTSQVAYLVFTKAAAKEAAIRISDGEVKEEAGEVFPFFRTLHSLAYRGLRQERPDVRTLTTPDMKAFSKWSSFEGAFSIEQWEDLSDTYSQMAKQGRTEWDDCLTAYTLSRVTSRTPQDLEAARVKTCVLANERIGVEGDVYKAFVEKYEAFKKSNGLVDFTDMLAHALTRMKPLDQIKYAVIDECQDLAGICHSIVDRLFQNANEVWWAGDDDQCQPAGTIVMLPMGKTKPIEDIRPGDAVASYGRRGAEFVGVGNEKALGKKVLRVSNREYNGPLYHVTVDGKTTRCTKEHRFIARWTKEARTSKTCITYLMKRENRFRVGWCQLFRADSVLHINARAHIERADAVWILSIHKNRTDASVHESVVACKYGLPTITFEPVQGARHMTKTAIDATFSQVGNLSDRAQRCLEGHGRDPKYPFFHKAQHRYRKRTTIMEIEACNLIPDLMALPFYKGNEESAWAPLNLKITKAKKLRVYSLEVDKYHTYIADGVVVHNCIYSFSAADSNLFIERARKAYARIFLRQTHRFGPEVVDFSQKIIHRVRNRVEKEVIGLQGREHVIRGTNSFQPTVGEMMILHRHVMGCQALAQAYIGAGLPFRNERGKNPLGASVRLNAYRSLRALADGGEVSFGSVARFVEELMPSMGVEKDEKVRFVVHGAKKKMQDGDYKGKVNLQSLVSAKILTEQGADLVRLKRFQFMKHKDDLEYYDRVVENGYDLEGPAPIITTMHGAKGRQSDRVIVFTETGGKCWEDPDTEHKLAYVAATRTKRELEICGERTLEWASYPYDYPLEENQR